MKVNAVDLVLRKINSVNKQPYYKNIWSQNDKMNNNYMIQTHF